MKYYRMIIKNVKTGERKSFISSSHGTAPVGWRVVAVAGCFEKRRA